MAPEAARLRLRRLLALAVPAAAGALLLAAAPAAADLLTPESGGSPNADSIDTLYKLILAIAVVVFVGVEGVLLWSLIKFRARKGAVAAQIHGNTRLEIGWTVGAAAILIFLIVFTFIKLPSIKNPPPTGPNGLQTASAAVYASTDQPPPPDGKGLEITVDGQQYVWRYQYPSRDNERVFAYERMVVPEDTTVILKITADDVAHSWWIPKLGGKMDAIPGYTNYTWFKARRGVYYGQCAELCGRNHANMLASVEVVSVEEYERWYDQRVRDIEEAEDEHARQRRTYDDSMPNIPDAAEGEDTGDRNRTSGQQE
ncbi:MAG TPA: cytochrome c oxidase subunit II [Solirubrobacteraceae bacterium]|nr:cytochrome c oxidase subunit II [Solirubrobacteraceae bacterium]